VGSESLLALDHTGNETYHVPLMITFSAVGVWASLFWLWAASELVLGFATRTKADGGGLSDRGSLRVLWITNIAAITVGTWVGAANRSTWLPHRAALLDAAVAMIIVGLAIRWTAILVLGRAFSVNVAIRTGQQLRTDGLYRWVRHPSYSGFLFILAAVAVATRSWLGAVLVVIPCLVALSYRIRVEEAALSSAFGPEYIAYCERTKRLIPGLY
jgi:protein-S-isoprenylcysteine O-methyltransferase Ste14